MIAELICKVRLRSRRFIAGEGPYWPRSEPGTPAEAATRGKLKRLVADLRRDKAVLQDVVPESGEPFRVSSDGGSCGAAVLHQPLEGISVLFVSKPSILFS